MGDGVAFQLSYYVSVRRCPSSVLLAAEDVVRPVVRPPSFGRGSWRLEGARTTACTWCNRSVVYALFRRFCPSFAFLALFDDIVLADTTGADRLATGGWSGTAHGRWAVPENYDIRRAGSEGYKVLHLRPRVRSKPLDSHNL